MDRGLIYCSTLCVGYLFYDIVWGVVSISHCFSTYLNVWPI